MQKSERLPDIISDPNIADPLVVQEFYLGANSIFQQYFGVSLNAGSVRSIHMNLRNPSDYSIGGSFDLNKKIVSLHNTSGYPNLEEVNRRFGMPWKGPLVHELGHALLLQWKNEGLLRPLRSAFSYRGWNRTAHEAFANLCMFVQMANGDDDQLTQTLGQFINPGTILFSPDRIAVYRLEYDRYEDPAVMHYLLRRFGANELKRIVLMPRGHERGNFLDPNQEILRAFSTIKSVNDYWFANFDMGLVKNLGFDAADISKEANEWYLEAGKKSH